MRGANDCDKEKVIMSLIKSQRVDLVCLLETKVQEMLNGLVRSLGVGTFFEWGALNLRGSSGGVLIFWDNRVLELIGMEVG